MRIDIIVTVLRNKTFFVKTAIIVAVLYIVVMPRPGGYGNTTATYIRWAGTPSRMYAKHQYSQELECGSTVVIYIPIEKGYKYIVITGCNLNITRILHHQKTQVSKITRQEKTGRCSRAGKRNLAS